MSRSIDKRILRTQKKLKDALVDRLRAGDDFHTLSVTEVTTSANCNRVTFYSHYKDLNALLNSVFDDHLFELVTYFRNSVKSIKQLSSSNEQLHIPLFEYIYNNQFIFSLIIKGELIPGSQNLFCHHLMKLSLEEIKLKDQAVVDIPTLNYYATYASLGFFMYWIESGFVEKPQEMAKKLTLLQSKLYTEAEAL